MKISKFVLAALAPFWALVPATSFAGSLTCETLFDLRPGLVASANLHRQELANYKSENIEAYRQLTHLLEHRPALLEQKALIKAIHAVLKDESLPNQHELIKNLTIAIGSKPLNKAATGRDLVMVARLILKTELEKSMPSYMAEERANLLLTPSIDKATLLRALGGLTKAESLEALIGPDGIDQISHDSLIGRYLNDALLLTGQTPSTLVGDFDRGPGFNSRGGRKLFVSVDRKTIPVFQQLFGMNPNLLMHNHEPKQGTLALYHRGQEISYAQYDWKSPVRFQVGKTIPMIVLSSREGDNATNYFTLGTLENKFAKYPGAFATASDKEVINYTEKEELLNKGKKSKRRTVKLERPERNYCANGGYGSCTHWVGEMPIGEKIVGTYSMPGAVGDDPYSKPEEGVPVGLQTQAVGTFNGFYVKMWDTFTPIGTKERADRLARIVWKQNAGNEQFWSMVGDKNAVALDHGEFANPGWVAYNLLANSDQDRVPVVFLFQENSSEPLTQNVIDKRKETIYPK